LVLSGRATADRLSQVRAIASPYRFSAVRWHARQYAELLRPLEIPEEARIEPAAFVVAYFARLEAYRALEETPEADVVEEADALERLRPAVESILASQVREAFRAEGIYGPADRLLGIPVSFPPVWFALEAPPHILVISPREEIASLHQEVLEQTIALASIEEIEGEIEGLGLSALVTEIGGIAATYPAIVSDRSSLRYAIETVAEEWLHQYLAFTPLGWHYVLHLLGVRDDYEVAQINESLAGLVRDEIAAAVWSRHYTELVPQASGEPDDGAFDYRAYMRETRLEAERLLAAGAIDGAEEYMEIRRQGLLQQGYAIRKLNQAYFAFHGTYADAPGSTTPIGDELRALRATCPSLSAYLNLAVGIRSRSDLLDLLTERGAGLALRPRAGSLGAIALPAP